MTSADAAEKEALPGPHPQQMTIWICRSSLVQPRVDTGARDLFDCRLPRSDQPTGVTLTHEPPKQGSTVQLQKKCTCLMNISVLGAMFSRQCAVSAPIRSLPSSTGNSPGGGTWLQEWQTTAPSAQACNSGDESCFIFINGASPLLSCPSAAGFASQHTPPT